MKELIGLRAVDDTSSIASGIVVREAAWRTDAFNASTNIGESIQKGCKPHAGDGQYYIMYHEQRHCPNQPDAARMPLNICFLKLSCLHLYLCLSLHSRLICWLPPPTPLADAPGSVVLGYIRSQFFNTVLSAVTLAWGSHNTSLALLQLEFLRQLAPACLGEPCPGIRDQIPYLKGGALPALEHGRSAVL